LVAPHERSQDLGRFRRAASQKIYTVRAGYDKEVASYQQTVFAATQGVEDELAVL